MVNTNRRKWVLGLSAAAAAAVALPYALSQRARRSSHAAHADADADASPADAAPPSAPAPFRQPLRIPGAAGLLAETHLSAPLVLAATEAAFPIFDGAPTRIWHYAHAASAGLGINPLLRIDRGKELDVSLDNRLGEDTTIHWHGLSVDEANDGSGLHPVAPGAGKRYRFRVADRAGLYWYHAHPHGRTGAQLQHGLAGLLRVDDDEERALAASLALPWGVRDLPLMISDKQVNADNAIVYRQGADDWIGNRLLVNWTPEPFLDVLQALYRFRIANVANARMLRLAFEHRGQSLPFHLIGSDGGLLARPWTVEDVFLAPAQRIDVLVDFSTVAAGERVLLRSLEYLAMENEDESGAFAPDPMGEHPGAAAMGEAFDLMQFCIAGCSDTTPKPAKRPPAKLPERLSDLAPPPDTTGWSVRPIRLSMNQEGSWFINDWNMHSVGHEPMFRIKRGSREVWEIRNNMTSMPHPIHVHGFRFRVVSRSISPPDIRGRAVAPKGLNPQDTGWNDTVVIWPGEIVRIAIDFAQELSGTHRYMIHCHNLEHEDMGMMVAFAVTD
ncbi:multicopper oxidase family protein [Lysobacter antibioticus]|uniref:multicopper oxidase family protein n=1 Tax=Lysobacter antibioticus TaxID=84531 RepID=UPI0006913D96|nr:multicopper oxidase domain-containing protein [Lysobacter antibioticus]